MRSAGPLVLIAVAVASSLWFGRGPSQPGGDGAAATAVAETPGAAAEVVVHLSGAVVAPGLITVPAGARVADVIAAAGGARGDARLDGLNLAAGVRDGEQIVVPSTVDDIETPGGTDGRISLNTASASELEGLPGVGPVLAARIAAYRDTHGPFEVVEDLLDVPGIGEGKLAAIRDVAAVP